MRQWIKEPLLHFIVLGAVIFLVYSQMNVDSDDDYRIVIDDAKVNHMKTLWQLQWKKEPTKEELEGLLERYVRQEIMYKEAKKLNLDQDDEIVKRRLSQKMEYLANDLTQIVAPATDENLKQYFKDNYNKYELPPSYSFNLITISNNQHEEPANLAIKVLAAADKKSKESLLNKGDPLLLPAQFEDASKEQIVKTVGTSFYDALSGQPLNTWVGPISSGYGEHLVFISDMKERRLPDFATVRKEIQRDYEFDMQTHAKGAIYREMKKQYTVVIDSELFNSHQKQTVSASLSGVR